VCVCVCVCVSMFSYAFVYSSTYVEHTQVQKRIKVTGLPLDASPQELMQHFEAFGSATRTSHEHLFTTYAALRSIR
jgi:hypothetical protein